MTTQTPEQIFSRKSNMFWLGQNKSLHNKLETEENIWMEDT